MLVGIVSDTHWTRPEQFDLKLFEMLAEVDHILHAGDVVKPFVLERLRDLAPVTAVRGNCDPYELDLPDSVTLEWEGVTIGMFHGHQVALNFSDDVVDYFDGLVDLIIHGHIHVPRRERVGACTVFCPGSPSQPRQSSPPAIGFLELEGGRFKLEHRALRVPG